jgi:multidrug resistance efflux pump
VLTVPFRRTVSASGVLEPADIWPVRSVTAGILSELSVAAGDTVQVGQTLAMLDTFDASIAIRRLRHDLAAARLEDERRDAASHIDSVVAETDVRHAEAALVRAEALLRERLVASGLTFDTAGLLRSYQPGAHIAADLVVADVNGAQASLQAARVRAERYKLATLDEQRDHYRQVALEEELRTAISRLERTRIIAPASGVIITSQIERLRKSAVREGEPLFEIADISGWIARLVVNERDVHRLVIGNPVHLEVPALSALQTGRIPGTLETIEAERSTDAARPGYRINVRLNVVPLDNKTRTAFRRGFVVSGRIVVQSGNGRTRLREWLAGLMEPRGR